MVRTYSFEYRRQHPEMFLHFCTECKPQRRFKKFSDKNMHFEMKHGNGKHADDISNYILSSMTASDLQTFVTNEIEPDTAFNSCCKEAVNFLCQVMKENFPETLRPSEIKKSGSLGKGTAVNEKSDADLVVFLVRLQTIPKLRREMLSVKEEMICYLGKEKNITVEGTTPYAVKVCLSCDSGHSHDVDILPSVDILKKKTKEEIYREMDSKSEKYRKFYSAALAPLQISFVSSRPPKLKTLIRLVKYWRKTFFEESTGSQRLPTSYPLELITIGEWEDAGSPENFDLRKGFYHVLRAITNYTKLKRAWKTNYDDFKCNNQFYVMDPANPFNNVMEKCNWKKVARKTRKFLNQPLFFGLSSFEGWLKN
ncbi:2'-5'-oligoadenylate synthase 1-like [Saccostrea cucullata]|uniref:2'-5'-oligoadenylate synthase 1-like n=1 Tax=Saccostrea cuccullata TaxID=36930 RepID=UPI002ED2AAD4